MLIKKPFKKGFGFSSAPYYFKAGYTALAVFWSSTLSASRGAALTGVVDSKVGTLSFWFKAEGSDSTDIQITAQVGGAPLLVQRLGASNTMRVLCENAAASIILLVATSTNTFKVVDGWKHVLSSWNLATNTIQMYVEDVSDASISFNTNDTIAYATGITDWQLANVGQPSNNDIADFYFDPTTFTDLTVTANRRKFISATLAPVNLGTNGQIPTGTSPALFFSGSAASWITNKGTGGGFTVTAGSIAAASTNPP